LFQLFWDDNLFDFIKNMTNKNKMSLQKGVHILKKVKPSAVKQKTSMK